MKKENRRKPSVFAGFVAGAEGLGLGCRLGCCSPVGSAQHRPRREPRPAPGRSPPGCRPPRHAAQAGLRPHLVAESLCALTKNREASIVLASLFLAGAEGLEPSARGFGVDVGERSQERGRGSVARFSQTSPETAVLIWCCEEILRDKDGKNKFFLRTVVLSNPQ